MFTRRSVMTGILGLAAAPLLMAGAVSAQDYPTRPVTIIVPYGPGGGVDINTRSLAPHLGEALGQEVVVENRTGGGGVTGHTMGAKARADGYTLTMVSPGIVNAPWLVEGVGFTPEEYAYIGQVTFVPNFLIVNADSPYQTVDDLLDAMKDNPGDIAAGQVNGWPSSAVAQAVFLARADVDAKMVPGYGGGADKMTGILGNHIDFAFVNVNEALPQAEAGKIRVLAAAADERSPYFPDVPTFNELGHDVSVGVWRTLAAPAGTPQEILDKLNAALQEALASPELKEDFEKVALTIDYLSPEATEEKVMSEYKSLGELFTTMGMNVKTK